MSNKIEIEASYYLDRNYDEILEKIKKEKFEKIEEVTEEDTYYTDKEFTFIRDKICLRSKRSTKSRIENLKLNPI